MKLKRRGRMAAKLGAAAALCAVALAVLPGVAAARKPIIAYIEDNQFKRFDAETGTDLPALPIAVNAATRFAESRNGRYVVHTGTDGKVHLFDRNLGTAGEEVPLPGLEDVTSPGFLTVSDNGLIAFDANVNPPVTVYDSNTKMFVDPGLSPPATPNQHRQPNLNGSGRFMATTCLMAANCVVDLGSDSNPYVQDLVTKTDTAVPDDNTKSEEDPCLSGDGNLVGWHKPNGADTDIYVYDRAAAAFLTLPNLNDAANDDNHCAIDSSGNYIGYMQNNVFKLYEISPNHMQVTLPAKPFELSNIRNNILADPFSQSPKPQTTTPAAAAATAAAKPKCKKKKRRHAAGAKKKRCRKKKR